MKDFKNQWKKLVKSKQATGADVLQYHLLRVVAAKTPTTYEDRVNLAEIFLLSAFTPISNKNKLEKGKCKPFQAVGHAKWHAQYNATKILPLLTNLETEEEITTYKKLLDDATERLYNKLEELYSYFFIRTDLTTAQMIIQTSHAAFVMGVTQQKAVGIKKPEQVNFVLCGVENLTELIRMKEYLEKHKFTVTAFNEPDLNNEATALTTTPVPYNKRGVARTFPLLDLLTGEVLCAKAPDPKPVFNKKVA